MRARTTWRRVPGPLVAVLLLIWAGLALAREPMRLDVDAQALVVAAPDGTERARFDIEIARTPSERQMGLMFRTDLPRDRAMLFVFDDEAPRSFWMRNTPTPLDIIYADGAGVIVSIARDTVPLSMRAIPSGAPARYVLEVHAGLTGLLGIRPGDALRHGAIAGAP